MHVLLFYNCVLTVVNYTDMLCYNFATLSNCTLQVHVNGFVSLGSPPYPPYPAWYPYLYSYSYYRRRSLIAPFWTDIDLRGTDGVVYLGRITRASSDEYVTSRDAEVFDAARQLVLDGFGDVGFLPTQVIKVTWRDVSQYPGYWYQSQVAYGLPAFDAVSVSECAT